MNDIFFIIEENGAILRRYIKTMEPPLFVKREVYEELNPCITLVEPAGTFPHEDVHISLDEFNAIWASGECINH